MKLCEQDARLGYHSEAEVYKYFPDTLKWRAHQLERLLTEDFAEAENVLASGDDIGEFLSWKGETAVAGKTYGANGIHWSFESDCESVTFHLDFDSAGDNSEVARLFFFDRKAERPPLWQIQFQRKDAAPTPAGWHIDYTISRLLLHQEPVFFFGVEKQEFMPGGKIAFSNDCEGEFMHDLRLNLGYSGADKMRRIQL